MKKNLVFAGPIMLIVGLLLAVTTGGTHDVRVQDVSIEKKDGYCAFQNNLRVGDEFSAEFTCHQPKGELRMVLTTESWYNKWKSGQEIPTTDLAADAYGYQGRITKKIQTDGVYYLVLVPTAGSASWPFDVSVKLEFSGGGGVGWFAGLVLLLGGAMVILGFAKKR